MHKKLIGISQKVMKHPVYDEMLDCLDQAWSDLLLAQGYHPIILPNIAPEYVKDYISSLKLDGLILSGGNTIAVKSLNNESENDISLRRDSFEKSLIKTCIEMQVPILGVCRGMQHINLYFGGKLTRIDGHAGKHRHKLIQQNEGYDIINFPKTVNTFHHVGIASDGLASSLNPLAYDEHAYIEAFHHNEKKIMGIMWHPEREYPYLKEDVQLIKRLFL